jgi:hypothetical protein
MTIVSRLASTWRRYAPVFTRSTGALAAPERAAFKGKLTR